MEHLMKLPPHDLVAERSVLGAILLDNNTLNDVTEVISIPDIFYHDAHKEVYRSVLLLFNQSKPIDAITVADILTQEGTFDAIGGFEYLSELTDIGVAITNVKFHAQIVAERYLLRQLITASNEIMEMGYNSEKSELVLDRAEQLIFDISQNKNSKGFTPISDIVDKTYKEIQELTKQGDKLTGMPTGFKRIDAMTSGFQKADLILIAARPSMGKTAFALNVCQHAATREKKSIAIFSLEMAKEQLVQRMLSSEAFINNTSIRTGDIKEEEWIKLAQAGSVLGNSKVYIDDTAGITVSEMRSKCRKLKLEHGLDCIMIDYLQLMNGSGKEESRQQEISNISRSLKALAREMECPVIALSQLSRAPEQRADHRPMLSDLRDSGAIEQDADLVMFLYRHEYYFKEQTPPEDVGVGEVIIAKQRNGEIGTVKLTWLGEYTRFADKEESM